VCHDHSTLGQDQLDVSQAQTENVIQPDGVADDFSQEAVSVIAGGLASSRQLANLPHSANRVNVAMP
jgi:hypothetical protein